jgi:hypothetical protein
MQVGAARALVVAVRRHMKEKLVDDAAKLMN